MLLWRAGGRASVQVSLPRPGAHAPNRPILGLDRDDSSVINRECVPRNTTCLYFYSSDSRRLRAAASLKNGESRPQCVLALSRGKGVPFSSLRCMERWELHRHLGEYLATSVVGWRPGNSWAGRSWCIRGGDVMACTPTQPPGCVLLLSNGMCPSWFSPRSLSGPQSQVCFRGGQAVYSRDVWGCACVPPCLGRNPQGAPLLLPSRLQVLSSPLSFLFLG